MQKVYREIIYNYLFMSNSAVASARKRRAGITTPTVNETVSSSQQQPQPTGLTLPQVIALIDSRLIKLENFMNQKDYTNNPMIQPTFNEENSNISEIINEFQQRFLILAEEINTLKDTVLKLQSYTMDVNKLLLEERIQVLSDIGENETFTLTQNETPSFE